VEEEEEEEQEEEEEKNQRSIALNVEKKVRKSMKTRRRWAGGAGNGEE
jgi:hypothetical protein